MHMGDSKKVLWVSVMLSSFFRYDINVDLSISLTTLCQALKDCRSLLSFFKLLFGKKSIMSILGVGYFDISEMFQCVIVYKGPVSNSHYLQDICNNPYHHQSVPKISHCL